jgi:uncharacterized coiled-coil protein SlyX
MTDRQTELDHIEDLMLEIRNLRTRTATLERTIAALNELLTERRDEIHRLRRQLSEAVRRG